MPGEQYGQLTVIRETEPLVSRNASKPDGVTLHRAVLCECACKTVVTVKLGNLPRTHSCGCRRSAVLAQLAAARFTTHGATGHPLFKLWQRIIERCENPSSKSYKDYGGRGVTVCVRWHDPWLFFEDIERELGPQPPGRTPGGMPRYTLNRKDNDGPYAPGNVDWADGSRQVYNSRTHFRRLAVLPGTRFGRLVVLHEAEPAVRPNLSKAGKVAKARMMLCLCDCGVKREVLLGSLRSGNTRSCGCLRREVSWKNARKASGGD